VTPAAVDRPSLDDPKKTERVGAIGVSVQRRLVTERQGVVQSVKDSGSTLGLIVKSIGTTLTDKLGTIKTLYTPNRDPEGFVGPVGASRISGEVLASSETTSVKILTFLGIIAGLNFFVGVFNLLPLLPLDGGHIAVLGFEQARDRLRRMRGYVGELQRVDLNKLMPLTYAVVLAFIGLTVWIMGADIVNPVKLPQ
jgi:membrane-associated protease RseP (regulator of RpoE activity)